MNNEKLVIFNQLAELAALALNAPAALLYARNMVSGHVKILGRFGTLFQPPENTPIPCFVDYEVGFAAVEDVQNDPRLTGHPLRDIQPTLNTLVLARVTPDEYVGSDIKFAVMVFNPPCEMFKEEAKLICFHRVIGLCKQFDLAIRTSSLDLEDLRKSSLPKKKTAKQTTRELEQVDPATRFLLHTLAHKHVLHERNGASYVSLRTWRKAIKEHQIDALVALKLGPPEYFVDIVAQEMSDHARILFGENAIGSVVPVPGGSSGGDKSLSTKIAQHVAKNLGAKYSNVLVNGGPVKSGRSHPKKSSSLQPFEMKGKTKGAVLLVDDVATSGRHMELALNALRHAGTLCFALSWIGP